MFVILGSIILRPPVVARDWKLPLDDMPDTKQPQFDYELTTSNLNNNYNGLPRPLGVVHKYGVSNPLLSSIYAYTVDAPLLLVL